MSDSESALTAVAEVALQLLLENAEPPPLKWLAEEQGLSAVAEGMVRGGSALLWTAVSEGIANFPPPPEYSATEFEVDEMTWYMSFLIFPHLVTAMDSVENPYFTAYQDRIQMAMEGYYSQEPYLSTFILISLQDGMMHWICEQDETVSPNYTTVDGSVYNAPTKQQTLAKHYTDARSESAVETGKFIENLEAFYRHRNAIVHGDPDAQFDMNIAMAAVWFLCLTLYTILRYHYSLDAATGFDDETDWERIKEELAEKVDWESFSDHHNW